VPTPADGGVIHLSSIDQVLTSGGARPSRSQGLWSTGSRESVPDAPASPAPSGSTLRDDDPIVEHQVRVPITLPSVRPGRLRLVIDIDLREERGGGSGAHGADSDARHAASDAPPSSNAKDAPSPSRA
jgi:hypothetical protein